MSSVLRRAAVAALSLATTVDAISVRGGSPSSASDQAARDEILFEFGGVGGLCDYFGWPVRDQGSRKPEIVYGTIVGNNGQQLLYDMHFAEVFPFVSVLVALDPLMTQKGKSRNLSLDMSEARWQRYLPKLRQLVLPSPIPEVPNEQIKDIPPEWMEKLMRPGRKYNTELAMENYVRTQFVRGLKDESGGWIMHPDDILLIADSDEIPLRESLLALTECEAPNFKKVRTAREAKADMEQACSANAKVLLKSQVYEYYVDCPMTHPVWWHPDAVLASCVMEGGLDLEDVRTGSSGEMTRPTASRHLHNIGMSDDDIVFKYSHYAESGSPEGKRMVEHEERRWRACDPSAPPIGPKDWHTEVRPATDLIRPENARGYAEVPEARRGLSSEFALLKERPELVAQIYWKGHGEKINPFIGREAGTYDYTGRV